MEPLQISTMSEATKESKQPKKEKKAKEAAAPEKPPVAEEAPAPASPPPPPPQTIEGECTREMLRGHPYSVPSLAATRCVKMQTVAGI